MPRKLWSNWLKASVYKIRPMWDKDIRKVSDPKLRLALSSDIYSLHSKDYGWTW